MPKNSPYSAFDNQKLGKKKKKDDEYGVVNLLKMNSIKRLRKAGKKTFTKIKDTLHLPKFLWDAKGYSQDED